MILRYIDNGQEWSIVNHLIGIGALQKIGQSDRYEMITIILFLSENN